MMHAAAPQSPNFHPSGARVREWPRDGKREAIYQAWSLTLFSAQRQHIALRRQAGPSAALRGLAGLPGHTVLGRPFQWLTAAVAALHCDSQARASFPATVHEHKFPEHPGPAACHGMRSSLGRQKSSGGRRRTHAATAAAPR